MELTYNYNENSLPCLESMKRLTSHGRIQRAYIGSLNKLKVWNSQIKIKILNQHEVIAEDQVIGQKS